MKKPLLVLGSLRTRPSQLTKSSVSEMRSDHSKTLFIGFGLLLVFPSVSHWRVSIISCPKLWRVWATALSKPTCIRLPPMSLVSISHFLHEFSLVSPPLGTVALLVLTFSSDYFRERSIHICIPLATTLVGFIVLGCIDPIAHRGVAYFACFLLTMGASAPSVLVATWYDVSFIGTSFN